MEAGCVFDNQRGVYILSLYIIELAESYGVFQCEPEDKTAEGEWHCEAVDEAIEALNIHVAEEGYNFGYGECGDFMYMPISWWSEE